MKFTKSQLKQIIKEELNEIFGLFKKKEPKEPRWAHNPVCATYEKELDKLHAAWIAAPRALKEPILKQYQALKREFRRECS